MELLIERLLLVKSATAPSASPKGAIYYLSDVLGQYNIWRFDGRRHDALFPWDGRISAFSISPKGDVAFAADVGGDERWRLHLYVEDSVRPIALEGVNNLGSWDPEGRRLAYTSTAQDPANFYVYVYDSEKGESRKLADLPGINVVTDWGAAGILVHHAESSRDGDIYLVKDGEAKNLTKHSGEEINAGAKFLGDNKIIYLTNRGSEHVGLAVMDLTSGEAKYLVQLDREIEAFDVWGNYVAFAVNEDGFSSLYIYHLPTGLTHKVAIPPGVVTSLSWRYGRLVFSLSGPRIGHEVFAYAAEVRQLTDSPKFGLDFSQNAVPEAVKYKASDGLEVPALLYKPAGSPPYRAVVWLHGGPESQERPDFDPVVQLLVRLGYLVAAPNFRGSAGYGRTYLRLDDGEKRLDAVRDVADFVKWLQEQGLASGKPCAMGGSYGGYLTLMSLALYPDLWSCGVEVAGITNLATFLERTAPWRRRHREAEYGRLEDRGLLERLSPTTYVDRIAAPLLVIHGVNDIRVPISEAEQLVERLKALGRAVEFLRLEGEGHVLSTQGRARAYRAAAEFIRKYL
nr:MAG: peptidase S9 [Thermoproteus sp. AZ2]